MDFLTQGMSSWDDMELLSSPSRGGPHRRVRSDPTNIMMALRAERQAWGGPSEMMLGALKRDLSPMEESISPASKKHAPSLPDELSIPPYQPKLFRVVSDGPCDESEAMAAYDPEGTGSFGNAGDDDIETTGKSSKKDVPMWTVEEDLLILQLVEKHGKRWSKIAQQLPGRTDNGVRNRWNRMERAQVLRQRRGPEAGYRCRRCGQPKRGHICAALTLGETPAGDDLQQKAEALSKLSADRMRPASAASEDTNLPSEPTISAQSTPQLPPARAATPDLPPLQPVAAVPVAAATSLALQLPVVRAVPSDTPTYAAPMPSAYERQPSDQFDEAQLDDFLEELQLHELTTRGKNAAAEHATLHSVAASLTGEHSQPGFAPPTGQTAMLSQASLNQLLMTLSSPELLADNVRSMPQPSHLAAF